MHEEDFFYRILMTFQDTEQQGIEKETKNGRGTEGKRRIRESRRNWYSLVQRKRRCGNLQSDGEVSKIKLGQACLFVFALQST